jgi:thiol-disulfide isomerase/thioredoxin
MRILSLLFFFTFIVSCKQEIEDRPLARIQGRIENLSANATEVKLKRMAYNGPETIDSAILDAGEFSLAVPADSEHLYRLEIGGSFLPLFMEEGDHNLEADFSQLYASAKYSNSSLTDQMRKAESLRLSFEARAQELQNRYEMALYAGKAKTADSARLAFEILRLSSKNRIKSLIDSLGPGPVSYLATSMLSPEEDFSYLDSLATRFDKEKPGKAYSMKLHRFMEKPRRLAPGRLAPDFSLPNPAGKNLSLSSYRGKWVLLDFWASWCKPCRAENPLLVELNKRYKVKGLQILSVSLDGEREAWMKAMVQDQMNWAHVSDLKGWQSSAGMLYGIDAIPASFLIDPEGKIAGKNLRGEALLEKLVEIFP